MTNNELFYFIGRCLVLDNDPAFREEIIEKISSDAIDWEKFVTHCSNHLILPSIYLRFKTHDLLDHLPDELAEYLKEIYDLNLLRNDQIMQQLGEITQKLNSNGISPIFLKGSGNMLDQLYQDRGERILGDIDFLVPQKDYLRAASLLEEVGYSIFTPFYGEIETLKHYPRITKPGFPAAVEIHRFPVTERFKSWFNPEMVDRDKKPVETLPGCYVVSDNHNIILNFVHGQLDHEGNLYGIVSFRDLYDLFLLSKRTPLTEVLKQIKARRKAIAYFAFARKVFGLDEKYFPVTNLSFWLFVQKNELNHRSVYFYHTYRSVVYLGKRIGYGAIGQLIQSFYSKEMRRSVINRLTTPQWYRDHLNSYASFFIRAK